MSDSNKKRLIRSRRKSSVASWDSEPGPQSTFSTVLQEKFKIADIDDIQYPEVRLYIEGVQIPFESINISTAYMQKPVASITIPPAAGLTEIARNYFPKVHIFFRDRAHERYLLSEGIEYEEKDIFKLLFSGVIKRSSYGKDSNSSGATAYIQFQCDHRDYITDEVVIKFGGRGGEVFSGQGVQNDSSVGTVQAFSSLQAALKTLEGLKPLASGSNRGKRNIDSFIERYNNKLVTEKDIETVDPSIISSSLLSSNPNKYNELKGIPSTLLIMWQLIKMDTYRFYPEQTSAMRRLYIPLMDLGLEYFKRMKGHRLIEEAIQEQKYSVKDSLMQQDGMLGDKELNDIPEVIVPPAFRTFIGKAATVDLAVKVIRSIEAGMGQHMTLEQLFNQLLMTLRYDKIYLSSPVQSTEEGVPAIDKIVKPLLPFYYSPVCNVFLPNMYHTLTVMDSYYDTPTRITSFHAEGGGLIGQAEANGGIEYRAPHEVRRALAYAKTAYTNRELAKDGGRLQSQLKLDQTLVSIGEVVATHELGQGIRPKRVPFEPWIMHLNSSYADQESKTPVDDTLSAEEQSGLNKITESWYRKYPVDSEGLNPWEKKEVNGLAAYQRNIINTAEYDYALSLVETRTGQLSGPFNPFVVPGYPCDVLDASPDRPSYHGFVVSVNHSINGGGHISTSVAFSSAMSYDEMQSYDVPPVFPWIRVQLGLDKKASLLNQPESTKKIASDYYKDVLGVGFADPTYMYDFDRGVARKVLLNDYSGDLARRSKGISPILNPESTSSLYDTVEGNLMMTRREIETMADIERDNLRFIHLEDDRSNDPSIPIAVDKPLLNEGQLENIEVFYDKISDVGRSTFLTYPSPEAETKLAGVIKDTGNVAGGVDNSNIS